MQKSISFIKDYQNGYNGKLCAENSKIKIISDKKYKFANFFKIIGKN